VVPTRHRLPLAHVAWRLCGRAAACCVARHRGRHTRCAPPHLPLLPIGRTRGACGIAWRASHRTAQTDTCAAALTRQPVSCLPQYHRPYSLAPAAAHTCACCHNRHLQHTAPACRRPLACPRCFAHALCCCMLASCAASLHAPHHGTSNLHRYDGTGSVCVGGAQVVACARCTLLPRLAWCTHVVAVDAPQPCSQRPHLTAAAWDGAMPHRRPLQCCGASTRCGMPGQLARVSSRPHPPPVCLMSHHVKQDGGGGRGGGRLLVGCAAAPRTLPRTVRCARAYHRACAMCSQRNVAQRSNACAAASACPTQHPPSPPPPFGRTHGFMQLTSSVDETGQWRRRCRRDPSLRESDFARPPPAYYARSYGCLLYRGRGRNGVPHAGVACEHNVRVIPHSSPCCTLGWHSWVMVRCLRVGAISPEALQEP
jgi:hypothetical protein